MTNATTVSGTVDARFTAVRDELAARLASGEELGAGLVVDIDGTTVVDLYGGWRDAARTMPWTDDTLVNVWSTSKMVTNLAALVLVDRGALDPHAPVATYWPEFAEGGKEAVEVRHVLGHTSGVSGWDAPVALADIYDVARSTERLAAQEPWWKPGTASGYHALNQGHLVGELVRRVTGKSLTEFVATEIAGPLGADFQIGALERDWHRIAPVVPPPPSALDIASLDRSAPAFRTFTGPISSAQAANSPEWRRVEIGAANGHSNARGVANILKTIALGGAAGGTRLLSPATLEVIFEEQSHGVISCSACRCASGSASRCRRRRRCRTRREAARATGAATAARSRSWTSIAASRSRTS